MANSLDRLLGRGSRRAQDNEDDDEEMSATEAEQQAQDEEDEDSMESAQGDDVAAQDDDEDSMEGDHDEERSQARGRKPKPAARNSAKAHRLAERKRIAAIMGCDAAKGREKSALGLALKTDLSPAQAAEMLAELPKDGGNAFAQAMAAQGNPDLGPAGDGSGQSGRGGDEASAIAAQIQAAAKKVRPYGAGGRRRAA